VRLAIFGATGRIGRHLTELALNAGHEVVVLVRDPARLKLNHGRLRVVVGDARDFDRVLEVVQGADAVLSALGPRRNSRADEEAHVVAVQNIVEAMRRTGVRRLVTVLGAAVDFPGDQKGLSDRLTAWLVRRLARHIYGAKRRELELLQSADGIEWVGVRPPVVTPGPPTGRYRVRLDRPPGRRVSAGDVAEFMLRQVESGEFVGKAPFIG
jgi:putative NADH-flavin reductase